MEDDFKRIHKGQTHESSDEDNRFAAEIEHLLEVKQDSFRRVSLKNRKLKSEESFAVKLARRKASSGKFSKNQGANGGASERSSVEEESHARVSSLYLVHVLVHFS